MTGPDTPSTEDGDTEPERKRLYPATEDAGLLRLLATGMSVDAIAKSRGSRGVATGGGSPASVTTVLAQAAQLVRDTPLLAPSAAAVLEKPGVDVDPQNFADIPVLAATLLDAYISDQSDSSPVPDPARDPRHYAALRYVEALLRQEEVLEALGRVNDRNAPLQASLPTPARTRLDDYLLYRNVRGRFETLDSLVKGWEQSVGWAEQRGESYTHDEFVDRLTSRDSLDTALSVLGPREREQIEARNVRPLDERFFVATRAMPMPIRHLSTWSPRAWWWFHVPSHPDEHFRDRLPDGDEGGR